MSSFLKLFVLTSFLLVNGSGLDAATKPDKAKDSGKKKEAAKKKEKSDDDDDGKVAEPEKLAFPVPVGHDSKGLKLPSYGPDGKLKMLFNIGVATRIDENDVNMANMDVQTYDDDGAPEIAINLPVSTFNLATRVIRTKQDVKITREDFELTGHSMEFNTVTREGKLGGGVKMIIFDLDEEAGAKAAEEGAEKPAAKPSVLPEVSLPGNGTQPGIKVTRPKAAAPNKPLPRE